MPRLLLALAAPTVWFAALFAAVPALAQPQVGGSQPEAGGSQREVSGDPPAWQLIPGSPSHGYRFEDASFVTPAHGWIVDGSGRTYETTNGGATWSARAAVGEYLRSTAFVSPTHGWIGTLYGPRALLETTDAAATLVDVTGRIVPALSDGSGICGLYAVDAQTVYGVGQWYGPAYVIKTTDGGATWQSRDLTALAGSLIDVYFFDPQRGIAVGGTQGVDAGGRALVLATEDGGATWTERFRSSGAGTVAEWAWKISFPTPLVGYVSVEYNGDTTTGKVLKTTDGGLTWTELAVPGGRSMQGIGFWSETVGWTSGRGTVMRTLDGGATWQPSTELDGSVNRFEFFGDSLAFAMGRRVFRLVPPVIVDSAAPPDELALALEAAPNPSAGAVWLSYTVPAGTVRVDVFDALGRRVATLADGARVAGTHTAVWTPAGAAPGVYAVRLVAGASVLTRRVVYAPR